MDAGVPRGEGTFDDGDRFLLVGFDLSDDVGPAVDLRRWVSKFLDAGEVVASEDDDEVVAAAEEKTNRYRQKKSGQEREGGGWVG